MFEEIFEALAPSLVQAIASLVTLLLGWLSVQVHRFVGLQIEERHRAALHSAIMSGVTAAMEGNMTRDAAIDSAVRYAKAAVPDAINALVRGDDSVLRSLARSKIQQVFKPNAG